LNRIQWALAPFILRKTSIISGKFYLKAVLFPHAITPSNNSLVVLKITAMPYVKVWLHLVWSTKERYPFLKKSIRKKVSGHIRENARKKQIYLDCVNGHEDHIHCLASLSSTQTISKLLQLIKGESSYWINQQKLCSPKFDWQDDYFAVSVSESQVDKVRKYIHNQEKHHERKSFQQEYDEFVTRYKF
jgi:putative transposase